MKRRREDNLYRCNNCSYESVRKNNFERHVQSCRHMRFVNSVSENQEIPETFYEFNTDAIHSFVTEDDSNHPNHDFENHVNLVPIHQDEEIEEDVMASSDEEQWPQDQNINNDDWFPFKSKLEMLLYILLHSKTHAMSDETAKFIWFIMKESGLHMPSFAAIKNMSFGRLTPESLVEKGVGENGIPFYFIKPSALIKMAYSHPTYATQLIRYGRFSKEAIWREQADGNKWKSTMKAVSAKYGQNIYFTDDFVMDIATKEIGKITNFIENDQDKCMYAEMKIFERVGGSDKSFIYNGEESMTLLKKIQDLKRYDHDDLQFFSFNENDLQLKIVSEDIKNKILTKNRFKGDIATHKVPINFFLDDTSSNISKKWHPLHCVQLQFSGLPMAFRQLSENVKFISSSTDVTILDMMKSIMKDIEELNRDGTLVYDAKEESIIRVVTEISLCVCDYNMMAEASNHMGASTNKFCPRCHAKKCDNSITKGRSRTVNESKQVLQRLAIIDNKELRQQYGLKPYPNCLWDIINPHSDIPIGLLHWMFLGIAKHLIKQCISDLSEPQQEKLQLLIEGMDQSSYSYKLRGDFIKYVDSRQGKDVKQYIQIAPYHMKMVGLPDIKVDLVAKLAEICKDLLTKEDYTSHDLNMLERKINNYLLGIKRIYPSLLSKVKTHLSTHIVDDIREHGPPQCYTEDAFEKMHGSIRHQIFNQNKLAKSRDTAMAFAEIEVLNHVISGGYFLSPKEEWVQSSECVRKLTQKREIQTYIGISDNCNEVNGVSVLAKAERGTNRKIKTHVVEDSELITTAQTFTGEANTKNWLIKYHKSVKCQSGDIVNIGNTILCKDENAQITIGLLEDAFQMDGEKHEIQLIKIKPFVKVGMNAALKFHSTRVKLTDEVNFLKASSVCQSVSLVHDCLSGGCRKKEVTKNVCVEQEQVDVKKLIWHHCNNNKFFFVNEFRFTQCVKV